MCDVATINVKARRVETFEAVRVTEEDFDKIQLWSSAVACRKDGRPSHLVVLGRGGVAEVARIDNWLVKHGGTIDVLTDEAFKELYEVA